MNSGAVRRLGRWRWVSLLALLALALAAAGAAWAAPRSDYSTKVYLWVRKLRADRTNCVGDAIPILATAVQAYEIVGEGPRLGSLYGVLLEAEVADPTVGKLLTTSELTSLETDPPGKVLFNFLAEKAGTTTVTVKGRLNKKQLFGVVVSQDTIVGSTEVVVEDCDYQVNVDAVWHLEDITLSAYVVEGALVAKPGAPGQYAGESDVIWSGETVYPPPCYLNHHPAKSRAYITGEKIGNDLLEVKVVFESTPSLLADLVCPETTLTLFDTQMLSPEDLRVWVPASGGSAARQPDLAGVQIEDGSALVQVRAVKK
ncbi:MAG: hypothetical protein ABI847_15645 [Anaerolineales bacterium]